MLIHPGSLLMHLQSHSQPKTDVGNDVAVLMEGRVLILTNIHNGLQL